MVTISFLTQRTYSCSNFVAVSSMPGSVASGTHYIYIYIYIYILRRQNKKGDSFQEVHLKWWYDTLTKHLYYMLITNLMHWLLFIHKIIFSSTCFEPQVLIFRRIQMYTCSTWYCHSLWEFLVACRYTASVGTDRPPQTLIESDSTIYCMYTTVSSWRWALKVQNM